MVDIARDPRWGRIAEGSGEDVVLGSAMAAARVRGYQGTSLTDPTSVLACVKHFAAYGAAEGGRDYNTTDFSERTLREIYLPPYKAAVDAGAGTVMCSFNEIAGVPASVNKYLLTDILKKEWQFDGFIVSDWGSIRECINHRIAPTSDGVAEAAILAGLDMDMESNAYPALPRLVKEGKVPLSVVDESVRRVLRMKFALGLFEDPYRGCSAEREKKEFLSAENRAAAREVARKSMVLLKNDKNVLPLDANKTTSIALIGPLANTKNDLLGTWSAVGSPDAVVSVMEGMKKAASSAVTINYVHGCSVSGAGMEGFKEAVEAAAKADVVVLVVGESRDMSGEAASRASASMPVPMPIGLLHEAMKAPSARIPRPFVSFLVNVLILVPLG